MLLVFFILQSEPVYLHNRPGESAGINIFRSEKMPWLLKHSFLATPKLFFISQAVASKLFTRRSDAYLPHRAQNREFDPGQSQFLFVPVVWHIAEANYTRCH